MSNTSLKERYRDYFDIGAAVWPDALDTHADLLMQHFSSLTCENVMKPSLIHPERERYDFANADAIRDFAAKNGMKMRGHTLIWHNQTPKWFFSGPDGAPVSREALIETMKEHINTVVRRYKGSVYCWDVVNEALSDSSGGFLRESPWLSVIGEDYIDLAFRAAHEADPDALLFYNDYNESDPEKSERIFTLVKGLLERGVPVHGIGLQAHWYIGEPPEGRIRSAIEKYASLGTVLHITEMDISCFQWDDRRTDLTQPEPWMFEAQAETYEKVFALFREYKDVVKNVTTWGVADDYNWLDDFPQKGRKNWPLLFDVKHEPKPAFERVMRF